MPTGTIPGPPAADFKNVAGWLRPSSCAADEWLLVDHARRAVDEAVPALASAVDVEAVAHHVTELLERPWPPSVWSPKPELRDDVEPAWSLEVSFGTLRVRRRDQWPLPDVAEAWRDDDELTLFDLLEEDTERVKGSRGVISGWSRASRARMAEACAQLDMGEWMEAGGSLAMVTLTMPGGWEQLAPTGKDFKKIMERFRSRWERALGPLRGVWKLEFQERGAPHLHLLVRVPHEVQGRRIDRWIAEHWVAACGTQGEDARRQLVAHAHTTKKRPLGCVDIVDQWSDHRRIAAYFNKHSAKTGDGKEYQHDVPELWQKVGAGPGRFWGYWNLKRVVSSVPVVERDAYRIRRQLRKIAEGRHATIQLDHLRHAGLPIGNARLRRLDVGKPDGRQRRERRKLRQRKGRLEALGEELPVAQQERLRDLEWLWSGSRNGGMWVLVNDGLELALRLAALYSSE